MHPDTEPTILRRLERCEREARLWRYVALAALVGGAVATVPQLRPVEAQGEAQGTVLKAPVVVTGKNGKRLVQIREDQYGGPAITVLNEDGTDAAAVTVKNGGMVLVNNRKGKMAASMLSGSDGGMVAVSDPEGKTQGFFSSRRNGGALTLMTSPDLSTVVLDSDDRGAGRLRLRGGGGGKDTTLP